MRMQNVHLRLLTILNKFERRFSAKKKQIQLVKLFLTNLKFSMKMSERGEWKVFYNSLFL